MLLQILVNHYREPEEMVGRLLRSIEAQEGVKPEDFGVLLYSDGRENELSAEFLRSFRFPISYRALKHRGVCATRNALLDDAAADYVMFCDADDCFHSTLGLYKLIRAARDLGVNCVGSPYEREYIAADGSFQYETLKKDPIRVHGKAFKRSYLVENDIRFPDELPFSGDMYFLWQAYNLEVSFAWMLDSFYTWKHNGDSVTRRDRQHRVKSYPVLMRNYTLLMEKLISRNRPDLCGRLAVANVQMMYIHDSNPAYLDGPEDCVRAARRAMAEYAARYRQFYDGADDALKRAMFEVSAKQNPWSEGVSREGVDGWLDGITESLT